jgi:hypothetical protein
MKKLTLSASEEAVQQAHRLARARGTSVSAMFERFIRALVAKDAPRRKAGPLTRRATGLVRLPRGASERRVLEDALLERHGLER